MTDWLNMGGVVGQTANMAIGIFQTGEAAASGDGYAAGSLVTQVAVVLLTKKFSKGAAVVENKVIESSIKYTKSNLKLGKQMHDLYKVGIDGKKEFVWPSGRRIDFLDIKNSTIFELKPFNPRAMKGGYKQLNNYLEEMNSQAVYDKHPQFRGIQWKTVLDTY